MKYSAFNIFNELLILFYKYFIFYTTFAELNNIYNEQRNCKIL